MDYSRYRAIRVERDGPVLTVSLHRPDALNAIDGTLHAELAQIFLDVADDEAARVIVLTGSGDSFSAGGDMAWLRKSAERPELFEEIVRHGKRIVASLLDVPQPVIARVNGPAVGLGATIALMCDIIFAADDTLIVDPHVRIGLVAGDGGAVIWPQLIGYARAKEYLLTGNAVPAIDAARIGLINRAVPRADLDGVTYDFARKLAGGARLAVEGTKKAVNIGLKLLAQQIMDASLQFEVDSNRSADHLEGVNAFVEKRRPVFTNR